MIQFTIGVTLLAFIVMFPDILIIAGLIMLAIYLCRKHPDLFAKLGIRTTTGSKPSESEDDLPPKKAKMADKMKPGYKSDPVWQKMAADLRKTMSKNRVASDKELRLEMLLEAEEYAKEGKWSEVDRIQRELQRMEA